MGHLGCLGDFHSEFFLDKGSPSCPLFPVYSLLWVLRPHAVNLTFKFCLCRWLSVQYVCNEFS